MYVHRGSLSLTQISSHDNEINNKLDVDHILTITETTDAKLHPHEIIDSIAESVNVHTGIKQLLCHIKTYAGVPELCLDVRILKWSGLSRHNNELI